MNCSKVIIQYHFLIPQTPCDPGPFNETILWPQKPLFPSLSSWRNGRLKLFKVPSLTCRISILHQFEPCAHAFDWQVGVSAPEFFFSTQINEWCCHVAGSNSISNFGIQNSTRIAAAGVNSIHNKKMTPSSFGKGRRKHHAQFVRCQAWGAAEFLRWPRKVQLVKRVTTRMASLVFGFAVPSFTYFPLASFLGGWSQDILEYI